MQPTFEDIVVVVVAVLRGLKPRSPPAALLLQADYQIILIFILILFIARVAPIVDDKDWPILLEDAVLSTKLLQVLLSWLNGRGQGSGVGC